jgi:hypothetical protein
LDLRLFPSSCRLPKAVWEDCAAGSCEAVPLEPCLFPSSCRLPNAVWEDCAAASCEAALGAAPVPFQLSFAKLCGRTVLLPLVRLFPWSCACSLPAVVCQMLCGRIVLLALVTLFPWSCACSLPAVVCQMLCGRTVLLETLMKAFQEGTSPCMHDQMDPFTNQVRIHTEDKTLIDAYVYVTPSTPSPIKSAYIPCSNLS